MAEVAPEKHNKHKSTSIEIPWVLTQYELLASEWEWNPPDNIIHLWQLTYDSNRWVSYQSDFDITYVPT